MSSGYVYVMINYSMPGLIKIGHTEVSSQERAKQLSRFPGVAEPFIVAYDVFTENREELEKRIHDHLAGYRTNARREFFRYPIKEAVNLLQEMTQNQKTKYEAIEILPQLTEKYLNWIEKEVSSVRIYQTYDRVYLEITKDHYIREDLVDQHIRRTDLGFISNDFYDKDFFDKSDSAAKNADKFLNDFDPYSIINCIEGLFTEQACQEINSNYHHQNLK